MSGFAAKLTGITKTTCAGLALTLSKDVGILQVLLDAQKPLTSHDIAAEKDLKERYVRELLGCLVVGEIIQASTNEAGTLLYYLGEEEKAAFRTRAMAFISFPKAVIKGYDQTKSLFSKTGPVGVRMSSEFHDYVEEYGPYNFDQYVEGFMSSVDGLKTKLESGIDVLEVGCGRGRLLAKIAQMFPQSNFTASDNVDALQIQQKSNLGHIPNIKCAFLDLCSSGGCPSQLYDWIFCVNVIHDVPNPQEAFENIRKLLKPDGTFTMIDFGTCGSPIGDKGNIYMAGHYAMSTFMSVGESFQKEDSKAMGACWAKQTAVELASAAGFQVNAVVLDYPITLYVCN